MATFKAKANVYSATLAIAAAFIFTTPQAHAADPAAEAAVNEFLDQQRPYMPVRVRHAEWTPWFEQKYSEFVRAFGTAVAKSPKRTVKSYMKDPSVNPYASTDPASLVLYSDCADFPYFLRTYFAYKFGLPMSIAYGVQMNQQPFASMPTRDKDLATAKLDDSPYGNTLTQRILSNVPKSPGAELNFIDYWKSQLLSVSTRTLRVGPLTPGYENSDFYPVKVNRNGIKPGTIVHSNGHVLIVYDVDAKGTIRVVDAHPDNSLQVKIVEPATLERSRPDHGFGFFNFRPLRLSGGQRIGEFYYGSKVVPVSHEELYDQGLYSLEQWFGPDSDIMPNSSVNPDAWKTGFRSIDFFDFLFMRMYGGSGPISADTVVGDLMVALCDVLQQRTADIDAAVNAGLPQMPHPAVLPANIFKASGPWEDFSTPSRDGRLRYAGADLPRQAIAKYKQGMQNLYRYTFRGTAQDYQRSLQARLALLDNTCRVTYTRTNGSRVRLSFTELVRRLPLLSFDPYHCPERRWGASGIELSTCVDGDHGGTWYSLQQVMRNTVGKQDASERFVVRSDRPITMDMLTNPSFIDQPSASPINVGASRSRVVDIQTYFSSQQFLNDLNK